MRWGAEGLNPNSEVEAESLAQNSPGQRPRWAVLNHRRPEGAEPCVSSCQGFAMRGRVTRGAAPGWFGMLLRSAIFGVRVKGIIEGQSALFDRYMNG